MTTQTDLKAYAVALAKEKWPVDIETVECEPVERRRAAKGGTWEYRIGMG